MSTKCDVSTKCDRAELMALLNTGEPLGLDPGRTYRISSALVLPTVKER